jgi:AcrR family transcriptional regulator
LAVKRSNRKVLREAAEVCGGGVGCVRGGEIRQQRSSVSAGRRSSKVALSVLAERGYRGASMREIAERSRASKETLYAWFGNKRGLFEELVGWQAERVDAEIAPNLEPDGDDPSEVLRAFAAGAAALAARRTRRGDKPGRHLRGDLGSYVRADPGRSGEGQRRP